MGKIFISYRRADSEYVVGRLYSDLCKAYGRENIFEDVDSIPLGVDFRGEISKVVHSCDILIALIGENWQKITDDSGNVRIQDPDDYVRIEIEEALKRGIPVIPIMTGKAKVPRESDLPNSLKQLAFRNAIRVRPDPDYESDFNRLKEKIDKIYSMPVNKRYFPAVTFLLFAALALLFFYFLMPSASNKDEKTPPERLPDTSVTAPPQLPAPASLPDNLLAADEPAFMIRRLTEADLAGKTHKELKRMRKEVYARHGMRFKNADLQSYFNRQPWYQPRYTPDNFPHSIVTETQLANIQFMRYYERNMR